MTPLYDSTSDTLDHIARVRLYLDMAQDNFAHRAAVHDLSKLRDPEKVVFDQVTPELKELTYGSDEYKKSLAKMKVALDHHYAKNSHHPEHYALGVSGMSLFDLLEMLIDWKAASERHKDGDILKSLEINKERFHLSEQVYSVLLATVNEMGWA